jgi:hypothetical protein
MAISIERVDPGELIRAADYNDVAEALETLDARITALEAGSGGPPGSAPLITSIVPEEPTERTVMEIHGHNFAVPASLNTIALDSTPITEVLPGSSDELLRAVVPTGLAGLPRNFTLSVQTGQGQALRSVRILPETVKPAGQPIVGNVTTGIGTILAGTTYTFAFHIDANAVTIPEAYRLHAIYGNVVGATKAQWESGTTFVGAANDILTIAPASPVTIGVQVTVPAGATSAELTLRAESLHNDPGSSSSSPVVPIVVGQDQPENDSRISVFLGELTNHMRVAPGEQELVLQVEYAAAGTPRTILVPVEARFAVAGTYDYAASVQNGGALWTVGTVTPANTTEPINGTQTISVQLIFAGTKAEGERRNLTVTATRRDTSGPGRIAASMVLPVEGFAP